MAAPLNTAQAANLLEDSHRQILVDEFDKYPDQFSDKYRVDTSSKSSETDSQFGTLGTFDKRGEGDTLDYDAPGAGYGTTYTHEEWAKGYQVTRIMLEDDQHNVVNRMPAQLGISLRETLNIEGALDFNRAFNSSYTGGDSVELCGTHTYKQSGITQANELSTASDLDETSLKQALIDLATHVDDRGKKIVLRPRDLLVPVEMQFDARQLLGDAKEVGTANNSSNPVQGALNVKVWNYLTDTDAWFIQCEGHQMNWFWRRRPDFGRDNDFSTDNMRFKSTFRASHGWSDWTGIFGSPGS